jgi:hypothetical protein
VIKVIPYVLNGIEGFVDTTLLGSNVVVSAQRNNGEVVRATVPNTSTDPNKRGKFFLARLPEGINYDVVITANSHATAVIAGVPVPSSTSITAVSTSGQPITLNASATTHSIGGTVTLINAADLGLDGGTVIVAAKQVLNGGPSVTVKSQVANLKTDTPTSGDYEYNLLTLPTAAPWLGSYSTGLPLPIELTPQPASVEGVYSIHGSAQTFTADLITVYATQTPSPLSVNISASDAINQDFTLTP